MKKTTSYRIVIGAVLVSGLALFSLAGVEPAPPLPAPEPAPVPEPAPEPVIKKAFVGVVTEKIRTSTAVQLGVTPGFGLTVESVVKGSAADTDGIKRYDILLELDGQLLTNVSHFTALLSMKKPGDVVTFKLLRGGEPLEIDVMLGAKTPKSHKTWKFEHKIEEFGNRLDEMLEREELMEHLEENINIDAEFIDETVRSALDKAHYHIDQWVGDSGAHTSIIHSSKAKSILTTDDGMVIIEGSEDGNTKVIALDNSDELVFKGIVGKEGEELADAPEWVKEQWDKISNKRVKVIIKSDIDIDEDSEREDSIIVDG